jgi:hypothetical protein
LYPVPPLAPWQSQSEPESMSESHLTVTFMAAGTVRSCQSALVRAMFIRARIVRDLVRDLVRDHVRAAHVRATLVRANLLSHIIYSVIPKMKDLLDLRFNRGGSEGEVGSTKSPSEPNRAGINLLQPGLSNLVKMHLSETCLSEPGLAETMSETMSKLAPVRATLVRATLGRATFIRAGNVRDYVRAHFHSQDYQGLCQSHINQTTIVRDHIRTALVTLEQ